MANTFIAFPSAPEEIGQTVAAAVSQLRAHKPSDVFVPWPELEIAGRFIATEVLRQIAQSDLVVADISTLNFNVTYEIGYAVGQKKGLLLTRYAALGADTRYLTEIGIFDTIGFKPYENSNELRQLIEHQDVTKSIEFDANTIARRQPLYLLDGKVKTDHLVRIKSRIKKSLIFFREFDPLETARLSPFEAISNVAQSAGIVTSFLTKEHRDSLSHNLRSAFVAGLAAGMGKHVLIIQLGDDPVPIDYRDLVKIAKHPTQIDDAIAEFAPKITEVLQGLMNRSSILINLRSPSCLWVHPQPRTSFAIWATTTSKPTRSTVRFAAK
jgi:hypothetical protein